MKPTTHEETWPVQLEIPISVFKNLIVTVCESRAITYWCNKVRPVSRFAPSVDHSTPWYCDEAFWKSDFQMAFFEFDDDGKKTKHHLGKNGMCRGLDILAAKYPHHFGDIMSGNDDMHTADAWLQCCLFNEIKYG